MLFEDTPVCIILDQPFLQYDSNRRENTVKLLENMTNNRQILLFTSNSDTFSNNKKIAIIGAGPAGMASAWFLIQQGYQIKIFEK